MAILFTQADGSDQHYDTYEEFEQAMILMKRLNGEEVPQDLLDESKAKNGVKEPKPFQVQIDGKNFESAISEATRELAEALDEVAENRTPVSDECENTEKEPKFDDGDKVRVVSAEDGTETPYHGFRIGSTVEVIEVYGNGKVDAHNGIFCQTLLPHHFEKVEETPSEFQSGDVVKVTESFEDRFGDRAKCGAVYNYDEILGLGEAFVGTVFLGDNEDKLELVCRAKDRLDK